MTDQADNQPPRRKRIRRYQSVTDRVTRRIYKLDRWRVPLPGGLPAISLGYLAGWFVAVALAMKLPLVGHALGLLPPSLVWVAIPLLGAWAFTTLRIDGRAPHRAGAGALSFWLRPKELAGLRPCPPPGTELAPLTELAVAPSGDEAAYRRGRVPGPARLTLRYPARVAFGYSLRTRLRRAIATRLSARAREAWTRREHQLANADRLRVSVPKRGGRALRRGGEMRIPAGRQVSFE